MRTSVLNHILALNRNFCLIAIIAGWSFYFLLSHNMTQILSSVWHRKVLKKPIAGAFFCLFLEKRVACIPEKLEGALMQTFSLLCFSVATEGAELPPTAWILLTKSLFSLITSSPLLVFGIFSHRMGGVTFNKNKANDKDDDDDVEAATRSEEKDFEWARPLFNSGLLSHGGTFLI